MSIASQITTFHPDAFELLGAIPSFLNVEDPRSAAEQFNENYAFGGGWRPMDGWKTFYNADRLAIQYPDDPPYRPVAKLTLRDETIWVYPRAWVAIEQPDGSVEISRMD